MVTTGKALEAERVPAESVKRLLEGAIDYAGLFPPAGLLMPAAVEEYAACRSGAYGWMLGRMLTPVARLEEFAQALDRRSSAAVGEIPWRVSAIAGPNVEADVAAILKFNSRNMSAPEKRRALIDSIEIRLQRPEEVHAAARRIPLKLSAFFELPLCAATRDYISAVRGSHRFAKVRAGGARAQQFPSCAALAGFIQLAVRLKVAFKATAGLHHAVRGPYPITEEQNAAPVAMHGFLNLLVAVALSRAGIDEEELAAALDEREPKAFNFGADGATWRLHSLTNEQLAETRRGSIRSWGSCSFTEPLEDLRALHLV